MFDIAFAVCIILYGSVMFAAGALWATWQHINRIRAWRAPEKS